MWEVHVERVIRLRLAREWTLGPYRFRWVARLVAWLHQEDTDNIWQCATVRRRRA